MMFFGAIYFMVPRLTAAPWSSATLMVGHRVLAMLGVLVLVLALAGAGWMQGADLLDAKKSFADIFTHLKTPLLVVSGAQLALLAANLLLLVNFLQSISASVVSDVVALNPIKTTEASAS
jgi:cytochrome c oxidase cbb3-type subunit 1